MHLRLSCRALSLLLMASLYGCATAPPTKCASSEIFGWKIAYSRALKSQIRYPQAERQKGIHGSLEIMVSIGETDTYAKAVIVRSSGILGLDAEVLRAAKATKAEAPVCDGHKSSLTINVPVVFSIEPD